jgi:hypothetical protein
MTDLGITGTLNINDLPFAEDRTRAWRELRAAGEAVSSGEEVVLTSAEAVEFAAKRPEIFSSAKASTVWEAPFRWCRSRSIHQITRGSAECLIPFSARRRWPSVSPNYAGRLAN